MKRFLHFWSLVLLLAGVCLAQTPRFPARLPFGGGTGTIDGYYREHATFVRVRLWFLDGTDRTIRDFPDVRFTNTVEYVEEAVVRIVAEKLTILQSLSTTNAGRRVRLVYDVLDEQRFELFIGLETFRLELNGTVCAAPEGTGQNPNLLVGYNNTFGVYIPGVRKATLLVRSGDEVIFDSTITHYTPSTNSNWSIDITSDHLLFPTEYCGGGYSGELTVWTLSGTRATYDLATGRRTSPPQLSITLYGDNIQVMIVGSPNGTIVLKERDEFGAVRTNHLVKLDGYGEGYVTVALPKTSSSAATFVAEYQD